jgi:hypothetical protein
MPGKPFSAAPALVLLTLLLAACSAAQPVADSGYNDERFKGLAVSRSYFKTDGVQTYTVSRGGVPARSLQVLAINPYLWRGALDTLSDMPVASADPGAGVLVTEWSALPGAPGNERFKVTAYVLGSQIAADGVKVTAFRQVRQGGQWVDAPADPDVAAGLQTRIVARAQDLRLQATASQ